jgi:hypothetical protein
MAKDLLMANGALVSRARRARRHRERGDAATCADRADVYEPAGHAHWRTSASRAFPTRKDPEIKRV